MPIPIILGAAALAAAGYGVKKGMDAKEDYEIAEYNNDKAKEMVDFAQTSIERQRDTTSASIRNLGTRKLEILGFSMIDFVNIYQQLKYVELTESIGIEEINKFKPDSPEFEELKEVSIEAHDMLTTAGGSIAAGTALAAGTYGAVMSGGFAAASTGTAIGALSGVAATNATLAWLGGGSLAAGGMGMGVGMAVLGGIVAGPALAIGGVFMASKAEEALNNSRSNVKKAERFAEESKNICSVLNAINVRANQIDSILFNLNNILKDANELMTSIVKLNGVDYRKFAPVQKKTISKAVFVAIGIKNIIDTPLLTEDGKLDIKSEQAVIAGSNYITKLAEKD